MMAIKGIVKKDIVGRRYGRLVVSDQYKQHPREGRKSSRTKWLCRCDCGNEVWVHRSSLWKGGTKSCGCLWIDTMRIEKGRAAANRVLRRYKFDSKKRQIKFNLTFDQFFSLTQQNCHYCGNKPSTIQPAECNNGGFIYNGIDRVDSNLHYNTNNCVSCCIVCNRAKNSLSQGYFIKWVEKSYKHLKKKGLIQ